MNATQPNTDRFTATPRPYAIVVGVDFTDIGDLALERAFDLAAAHKPTDVHVVYVASDIELGELEGSALGSQIEDQTATLTKESTRLNEHVQEMLRRWCEARACPPSFDRLTTNVRFAHAAESLAQFASDVEASVVVVGTHGRHGARQFFLGSVAERTVRLAPCDVLVVRPPDATIPKIEPPCPSCLETRRESNGSEMWCERHRQHHAQPHTYHFSSARKGHQSGWLIHTK